MKFAMVFSMLLIAASAMAGQVHEYDVYANPKLISAAASQIRLVEAVVKKVPATYKLVEPINCDRSENNCRAEEVVASKVEVVQALISFQDGRKDDYGQPEADFVEINLPISKFSNESLTGLRSKNRADRKNATRSALVLNVEDVSYPTQRENCYYNSSRENWECDGTTYTDTAKFKAISVQAK